jgi:arsenite transporter
MVGKILSTFGAQGPVLLVMSLVAGLLSHGLAQVGYLLLPVSAFLLTLGSFLTAGLAPSGLTIRRSVGVVALVWAGLALPLAAAALLWFIPLDPALRAGVLLSLLAPPVGSAAAIAAMLGLQPRLALVVSIVLTLIAPLSLPFFASVLGLGVAFDMGALAVRLFAIVGTAALVAFAVLRFRHRLTWVLPDQQAATSIAVIGLIIVGLATSQGVRTQLTLNPFYFEKMLAAAVAINFGLCVLSAVVFARLGLQIAGTVGLVSGNRNVTLAWAAASFGLPPLTEGYVAACVIPVLALPMLVRLGVTLTSFISRSLRESPSIRERGVPS